MYSFVENGIPAELGGEDSPGSNERRVETAQEVMRGGHFAPRGFSPNCLYHRDSNQTKSVPFGIHVTPILYYHRLKKLMTQPVSLCPFLTD